MVKWNQHDREVPTLDNESYHVFISYRRELGFSTAMMIRDRLTQKGIHCFLDLEELRSGTFDTKILTSIRNTRNFILVLPPNALDRCTAEDDWLAREVLAAMEYGCNIIPLLCNGYEWPDEWDPRMPKPLCQLPRYNSVFLSPHYLEATVDRLIEFMQELPMTVRQREDNPVFRSGDTAEFFGNILRQKGLVGLDMAFHAGAAWHTNDDKLNVLSTIADQGIPIRVLVNTPEAAEVVARHMRRRRKRYTSFAEAIGDWQDFASDYPNVQVRVCDIPLLHIYYSFHMEPSTQDLLWVKYYTYGNYQIDKNYMQVFYSTSEHFPLYREEFEFLWNSAQ